jgi:Heavy-metal-associated domain.
METLKFKTDIKCSGCVAKVTPNLNASVGENNWSVDTTNPAKILTVVSDATEAQVKEAVQKAGYKIERV